MERRTVRGLALGVAAAGAMALLSGCGGLTKQGENTVNGKQLFVAKCGSCHVLNRAGTKGVTGPNLDAAFERARQDGFKDSTFEGMIHRQIGQPARNPQVDPVTGKTLPLMPANLVKGEDAADVAAYVASAVGKGGKDAGALAQVGAAQAKGTAKAKGGKLQIPADPGGALAYTFAARSRLRARSRSTRPTSPRYSATSRSRAAGSTRPARSSPTAASPRST